MAFVGIAVVLAFFIGLFLWDRRTRRQGHKLRDPSDIWRSELDVHRNVRAAEVTMHNPVEGAWTTPDDQRFDHPKP